jgi:uncharacterized protein with GYD domain
LSLRSEHLDSVGELYTEDDFRQLVVAIEATPVFLGRLGELEDHGGADAFKDMAKKCGATVKDVFWTLGEYAIVAVVEAPDDISITALGLSTGALGNVRTQTLRAFTQADMKTIRRAGGAESRRCSAGTIRIVFRFAAHTIRQGDAVKVSRSQG